MPGSPLTIPNNEFGPWPAYIATFKAGGAIAFGDVVMSTDSIAVTAATTGTQALKGVAMRDARLTSYVLDNVVPVLLFGTAVVITDAAVTVGAVVEASSVVAAGRVRSYVEGADVNKVSIEKVIGRALTAGGAAAKALVAVGW